MPLDKNWYTEEWAGQGSAISLKINRKVHDEQSTYQRIEIYETETFGTLMTLDGLVMVTDRDNFVYHEMMSHPALFSHPGIKWVADAKPETYDVIIIDSTDPVGPAAGLFSEAFYKNCFRALRPRGIVVGQSESPLFHADLIRSVQKSFTAAGFRDVATLFFPQCTYPSGWWSATMAGKDMALANFRVQDAAAKTFATRYYNRDIHAAALASPEFLRIR
jgi:spermidine synthase